jgi:hypothetical protein
LAFRRGNADIADSADSFALSSGEKVVNLVNKLPQNASLPEIAREIELLAGIEEACWQARRGEGVPAEHTARG